MCRILLSVLAILLLPNAKAFGQDIFDAIRAGDVDRVTFLLAEGDDIAQEGPVGTPLHLAALVGQLEIARKLVESGAEIDATNVRTGTPLHAASNRNHADIVRFLLAAGATVDARDSNQFTPLHFAAQKGSVAVVALLLEKGADPNAVGIGRAGGSTGYGYGMTTPFHLARWSGHTEVAVMLEAAGGRGAEILDASDILASADPERGKVLARNYCSGCHVLEDGDTPSGTRVDGPILAGVFGRPVGSVERYRYSQAMLEFGGIWYANRLYNFLIHPMLTVPGTRMYALTTDDPGTLADIVAHLKESATSSP